MASDKHKKILLETGDRLDIYGSKGISTSLYQFQKMRTAAIKEYQATGRLDTSGLWRKFQPLVSETVRDGLIVSHLTGYEASLKMYYDSGKTKLSTFDKAIKKLKEYNELSDVQLGIIQAEYGKYAASITGEIGSTLEANAQAAMQRIIADNVHVKEGVHILREAFEKSGITPAHKGLLETLVRTNIQVAYSSARWQVMSEPAIDEILWGYEYFTAGDGDVRPNHAALDGTILPKDDPRWKQIWPPNGFNCRCQVIEIFEPAQKQDPPVEGGADKGWEFNPGERLKILEITRPAA